MKVLLTNDDGLGAPGLTALARRLRDQCDVVVVAPHRERSGIGHSVTYLADFWVEPAELDGITAYVTSGTPADCVRWALSPWCEAMDRPDVVVSGINRGHNCGIHVFYSGTVAAALEAAFGGIPGVAVSMHYDDFENARAVAQVASEILFQSLAPLFAGGAVVYNVNVPAVDRLEAGGIMWTHPSGVTEEEVFELTRHEGGMRRYFRPRFGESRPAEAGSDRWAVAAGRISVSRLRSTLSDERDVPK